MSLAMTCSECWTTVPGGVKKCPRCGAAVTGAAPSVLGLLKSYPWLAVVLGLSAMVTLWAATRRAPAPVQVEIPPAVEPAPVPAPEPEAEPAPAPVVAAPAAPAAEPPPPAAPVSLPPVAGEEAPRPKMGKQLPDGTFQADPGALSMPR